MPEHTTEEVERRWEHAMELHPDWIHLTFRDPIDPGEFPLTSPYWKRCQNGAQLAGLIRLEALWKWGGIYIDSDVDLFQPLDRLRGYQAFAAFENRDIVPDAVIGARNYHPAIEECISLARLRITGKSDEKKSWMTDRGAFSTGPGVTTTVFRRRNDVALLGPESFYPVFYDPRDTLEERMNAYAADPAPWSYGMHRWNWSWR